MRRRSRAGGDATKARRRKTATLKRRTAPNAVCSSSDATQETELARVIRERDEALARQIATSEILRVISQSPTDVQPVFDSIVLTAARLLRCDLVFVLLCDGATYTAVAVASPEGPFVDQGPTNFPIDPSANFPSRAIVDNKMLHLPDWSLIDLPEHELKNRRRFGVNSALYLPLLRGGECIGLLTLIGKRPNTFGVAEIAQAESFRDQALIAIENARLFKETKEALEQQTATADVLKVISRSTFDLQTVLQTLAESAARLCEAEKATITRQKGAEFYRSESYGFSPEFMDYVKDMPVKPERGTAAGRALLEGKAIHIPDVQADPEYTFDAKRFDAYRTILGVPMLREGVPIGVMTLTRSEVRPFTERQIELVSTFADQAVIAIENTRLFEEEQQRTRELTESLKQQTATADVLKVISRSTFDLQTVLDTLIESAARLCEADKGAIFRPTGNDRSYYVAASYGHTAEYDEYQKNMTFAPGRGGVSGRVLLESKSVQIPDVLADPEYTFREIARVGNYRTIVGVPLLREGVPIGVFALQRAAVRPFTETQIKLVETFADQAVIAIENVRLFEAEQQRTRELTESLEQQTATSEVLRVISSSPGDLQPVFEVMLKNAVRICDAKFGNIYRWEGDALHLLASHNTPTAYAEHRRRFPLHFNEMPESGRRMIATMAPTQDADILALDEHRNPVVVAAAQLGGIRTILNVPMVKEHKLVGAFIVSRQEVCSFTDEQIELVKNFAAQAVIAIENTRLLNELRQRTDDLSKRTTDLTESLEQQTATSEVLKVISSSPGDLQSVFAAMLENAVRICGAKFGLLFLSEGDAFRTVALHGAPPEYAEQRRTALIRPNPGTAVGRVATTKKTVQIDDIQGEPAYTNDPERFALLKLAGARTILAVPMLKEEQLLGQIVIYRQEVWPFSEQQIELVQNFAAQAVIAIENTRLLSELRQRTDDLTESLEQQTATSDVLRVISSSPADIQPVLETIGERAQKLCDADISLVSLVDGELIRLASIHGMTEVGVEAIRRAFPHRRTDETITARAVRTRSVCHVADVLSDPQYQRKDTAQVSGTRGCLGVPMVRDEQVVGAIFVARRQPGLFSETQVQLLKTFADQAVIAIENVRLFKETKISLEQQTATADVLKIISRSTFDLRTVLQTLLESAARFCDADKASIIREKDGAFYAAEAYGYSPEFLDYMKNIPVKAERGSASGRALVEGRVVHITDVAADPEYTLVEGARLGDYRTVLCVPMLREGVPIGLLVLTRSEVQAFTEDQIELVTTFADQAAIAIENVRLFEAEQQRTRELAESLEDLRTTQDRLVQTQKLASLGQLTAGIAHEIKNPLNFVNNFSGVSVELIDELKETLGKVMVEANTLAEITELTNTLRDNLNKIVQHGKRADSIVKNMLLHSREGSGEHRPVDINALVEEAVNLAYHGARAEKQGFNINLERSMDPAAGQVDCFPQEITRVLLNLISNGFYAATKRKAQTNDGGYEPTLTAATKNLGDRVEIRIRDNGTGISPEVKEKLFNPFFTTKPAGEGTGLGLSICHDIVVKQHSGAIEVDSQPGEHTEVRIVLLRAAAFTPGRPEWL
jgi:two-component system, NtrC family, sensor kinase